MNATTYLNPKIRSKMRGLLKSIRPLLRQRCVQQIWIFGSANSKKQAAPHDIDIAIICPHKKLPQFADTLASIFPSCVVDRGDYTRTGGPTPDDMPFHFVVASLKMLSQKQNLARSISSGKCVVC